MYLAVGIAATVALLRISDAYMDYRMSYDMKKAVRSLPHIPPPVPEKQYCPMDSFCAKMLRA